MCGIFGAIGEENVRDMLVKGIRLLQHRGKEGEGILLIDPQLGSQMMRKTLGRVAALPDLEELSGTYGVIHRRYATTGTSTLMNNQPFWTDDCRAGFVHNGQVVNMLQLRMALEKEGK